MQQRQTAGRESPRPCGYSSADVKRTARPIFVSPTRKAWTVPNLRRKYSRRLLGNPNISTTQRYMHLDDRELADAQVLAKLAGIRNYLSNTSIALNRRPFFRKSRSF